MNPFLDVTKLTDEDIIDKLGKAYSFLNYQTQLGHMPTVKSIKEVIQTLEDERHSRMQRLISLENEKKYPSANKPIELGKLET